MGFPWGTHTLVGLIPFWGASPLSCEGQGPIAGCHLAKQPSQILPRQRTGPPDCWQPLKITCRCWQGAGDREAPRGWQRTKAGRKNCCVRESSHVEWGENPEPHPEPATDGDGAVPRVTLMTKICFLWAGKKKG